MVVGLRDSVESPASPGGRRRSPSPMALKGLCPGRGRPPTTPSPLLEQGSRIGALFTFYRAGLLRPLPASLQLETLPCPLKKILNRVQPIIRVCFFWILLPDVAVYVIEVRGFFECLKHPFRAEQGIEFLCPRDARFEIFRRRGHIGAYEPLLEELHPLEF